MLEAKNRSVNGPGHMTKVATMSIYGNTLLFLENIFFKSRRLVTLKIGMKQQGLNIFMYFYSVKFNHGFLPVSSVRVT